MRSPVRVPIAIVLRTLGYGGAERFALKMISCMDPERWAPHVFVLVSNARHDLRPELQVDGPGRCVAFALLCKVLAANFGTSVERCGRETTRGGLTGPSLYGPLCYWAHDR